MVVVKCIRTWLDSTMDFVWRNLNSFFICRSTNLPCNSRRSYKLSGFSKPSRFELKFQKILSKETDRILHIKYVAWIMSDSGWGFHDIIWQQLVSENICSQDSENTGQNINSNLITGNVNQMDAFKTSCLDQSDPTVTNHETTKESSHQTIIRLLWNKPKNCDCRLDLYNVKIQSLI